MACASANPLMRRTKEGDIMSGPLFIAALALSVVAVAGAAEISERTASTSSPTWR